MKGNVGEVLAFEKQLAVLVELAKRRGPGTVLITGVRIRLAEEATGKLGRSLLLSDNIIATMGARDLTLRGLFEVKTGSEGVAESAEQVFRWIEDRLTPGSQIVLGRGLHDRAAGRLDRAPHAGVRLHLAARQTAGQPGRTSDHQSERGGPLSRRAEGTRPANCRRR